MKPQNNEDLPIRSENVDTIFKLDNILQGFG